MTLVSCSPYAGAPRLLDPVLFPSLPDRSQGMEVRSGRPAVTVKDLAMTSLHRLALLLCPLAATLSVSPMLAQTITASVTGTVTDASGAVIPNANVAVRNVDTGVATMTTANGDGVYSVRFLPIGRYSVTISAPRVFGADGSTVYARDQPDGEDRWQAVGGWSAKHGRGRYSCADLEHE